MVEGTHPSPRRPMIILFGIGIWVMGKIAGDLSIVVFVTVFSRFCKEVVPLG